MPKSSINKKVLSKAKFKLNQNKNQIQNQTQNHRKNRNQKQKQKQINNLKIITLKQQIKQFNKWLNQKHQKFAYSK